MGLAQAARAARTPGFTSFRSFHATWRISLSARALKILIASGTFHPESGGPPTYLLTLGRELLARGHAVRVVTYGDERAGHRYPYPVTRVPRRRSVPGRLALFTREVVKSGRWADLLFVNDYGLPAAAANLLLRRPVVMKIVGDFVWEYSVRHGLVPADEPIERFQTARYGPTVELLRRVQTTYTRRADLIVTPSQYLGRVVVGWGVPADRVRVVENAVADPTRELAADTAQARYLLGLPSESDVILAVARLTAWKGIDTLIAALAALREQRPNATLVVVGDGPDRARLESLAVRAGEGAVRFTGEAPRAEVALHLRAASILALCSGYEGLSHVLLEAMVAGVPIVASAVGGNLELVRDGETGLLVPFGDVEATRAALARLLEDEALSRRLAACARAEAAERTVDRMVEQTVAVFREAIEGHRRT
jgi:glycosyltransferase involved in cell wall biosynthesis